MQRTVPAPRPARPRDVVRFHRWYRRLQRWRFLEQEGPARAASAWVKAPFRKAREAHQAVRRYGAAAYADSGVSRPAQFVQLFWLALRHGTNADTFYRFALYRDRRWRFAARYVEGAEAAWLYRLLAAGGDTAAAETLADKRRFAAWCERHDVPTVPILLELDGGRVVRGAASGGPALPPTDLFAKPAAAYGGVGVARWRRIGGDRLEGGGRRWTEAEVLAELLDRSRCAPIIVQACQRNHPALASVAPCALGTVRALTIRATGEAPRFLVGIFRTGTGAAVADNLALGGIISLVDTETGVLQPGMRMDDALRIVAVPSHPDTGARFAGLRLPYWPELIALTLRAHEQLGDLPCIGWDVAMLEDGPVLVEGNWNPDAKGAQMPLDYGLCDTDYLRCMNSHLERLRNHEPATLVALVQWEPGGTRERSRHGGSAVPGVGVRSG